MRNSQGQRLEWVDTLRGFAALGVAVMHCFESLRHFYPGVRPLAEGSLAGVLIDDVINLGKVGVVVFFFISGYLIPFSLHNKDLKQFAITRFFRLYPAYWCAILLSLLIISVPPAMQLLANITMFQKFFGIEDINGVFWTLQIELVFYFVCAFLFYRRVLDNVRTIENGYYFFMGCSLLMAAVRYYLDKKLPVALPLGLTVMFLGILTRKYMRGEPEVSRKNLGFKFSVFIAVLLPICLLAYNRNYGFNEKWYRHFISYGIAVAIFLIVAKYKWHNRVFAFLGNISYSLYLLHTVTGGGLTVLLFQRYPQQVSPLVFILLFFSFSIISAALSYYLVEKPFVAFGRRITNKRKPVGSVLQ